jgi:hypothetical protein
MMLKSNFLTLFISQFSSRNNSSQPALSLRGQLRWQYRHKSNLLGWPGIVALGLLVIAPIFYFSAILPMQIRLDTAQHNYASVQNQLLIASKADRPIGGNTPREQLVEFYKFFPDEKNAPEWLGKLDEAAEKSGLSLIDGEYKVTQDKVGKLIRLRVAFPVQGKYPQIREFLTSLPAHVPPMALENVQFERNNTVDSNVEAKIKMVLYLVQKS